MLNEVRAATERDRDLDVARGWREVEVMELSVQADHVHVVCSVPPKVSISGFTGLLKGKLAIKLFKSYPELRQKPYWGNHFWARGYFVSTVGVAEEMIRRYVQYQEEREHEEERQRKTMTCSGTGPNTSPRGDPQATAFGGGR